jgi:heme-degrading monooxygenase HmoA
MHARVTDLKVPSEKLAAFQGASALLLPLAEREAGFRAVVILRLSGGPASHVRVISVWDSLEDMKTSEKSMFFYQALTRMMQFSQGFPVVEEFEVMNARFAGPRAARAVDSQGDTQA